MSGGLAREVADRNKVRTRAEVQENAHKPLAYDLGYVALAGRRPPVGLPGDRRVVFTVEPGASAQR
jgi:hypothetical protein